MLERITKDLYAAQKARDAFTLGVLRFLKSAIQNKEIELRAEGGALNEEIIQKIIKKQIKQRNQTIDNYVQAGREDEASAEKAEIVLLETYLIQE